MCTVLYAQTHSTHFCSWCQYPVPGAELSCCCSVSWLPPVELPLACHSLFVFTAGADVGWTHPSLHLCCLHAGKSAGPKEGAREPYSRHHTATVFTPHLRHRFCTVVAFAVSFCGLLLFHVRLIQFSMAKSHFSAIRYSSHFCTYCMVDLRNCVIAVALLSVLNASFDIHLWSKPCLCALCVLLQASFSKKHVHQISS